MVNRTSLAQISKASKVIDPVFLNSPQYNCESLSALLKTELLLKVETVNPIRSFKGRGADFFIHENKTESRLLCASAGNFGQAMAYSCRRQKIRLQVYAASNANPLKVERMRALGAEVILFGDDFDSAKEEARRQSKISGIRMVEDALAVETAEGAGTIALELLKGPQLDVLLVPLGNGALFNGIATVFKEVKPSTQMIAVQAAGAPAMVESWKSNEVVTHPTVSTIADGIAVRLPIKEALNDMRALADDVILVKDSSILEAMKLLHTLTGLVVEPSAAVGVAAILENRERFIKKSVGTIICGGNLTDDQARKWLI